MNINHLKEVVSNSNFVGSDALTKILMTHIQNEKSSESLYWAVVRVLSHTAHLLQNKFGTTIDESDWIEKLCASAAEFNSIESEIATKICDLDELSEHSMALKGNYYNDPD